MIAKGTRDGPTKNEYGKDTCIGCKYLGIHDWHYPYCAAQKDPNNEGKDDGYPWRDAGTHIFRTTPNAGCPFMNGVAVRLETNDREDGK